MKFALSLLASAVLCATFTLFTGCTTYTVGPAPVVYSSSYPVSGWGGAGFYSGSYYRNPGWNNNAYYHNNSSGYYNNSRGGSASWNDGSGSAHTARGGSASWGGGSGSWNSARGGSGSWHR